MGPLRAQRAPTGTHWRVTTVTRAVDELSLTLVPVLVGGGGQVLGDTGASGQPFLGPNSQGPCAVSARSRRACLLTVLGAGGRCSGARVGLVMAGVGPLWREIGGQEDMYSCMGSKVAEGGLHFHLDCLRIAWAGERPRGFRFALRSCVQPCTTTASASLNTEARSQL